MQTQATLSERAKKPQLNPSELTTTRAGRLVRIFGCWHREMSRPFTDEGETYCACLSCGARRRFNLKKWEMVGAYYYQTPAHLDLPATGGVGRRARRAVPFA